MEGLAKMSTGEYYYQGAKISEAEANKLQGTKPVVTPPKPTVKTAPKPDILKQAQADAIDREKTYSNGLAGMLGI